MKTRYAQRGVTLVEMLVVVVIVSILATIAVPSYQRYYERARQETARGCLQQLATRFESFQQQTGRYPTSLAEVGVTGSTFCQEGSTARTTDHWYSIGPAMTTADCSFGFKLEAITQQVDTLARKTTGLRYCYTDDPKDRITLY